MLNLISSLGGTRLKQKWSNGTEFSGYSDFLDIRPTSRGTPKISELNSGKCLFHSPPKPRISGIFGRMESALGYPLLISTDFDDFISPNVFSLVFVLIEKIYQTLETMFHRLSKHLKFRQMCNSRKYPYLLHGREFF